MIESCLTKADNKEDISKLSENCEKVCVWDSTLKSLKNSTEATEKSNSKHTSDITQSGETQEEDP